VTYAPKAPVNAVHVTLRTDMMGTDNAWFCQAWASKT